MLSKLDPVLRINEYCELCDGIRQLGLEFIEVFSSDSIMMNLICDTCKTKFAKDLSEATTVKAICPNCNYVVTHVIWFGNTMRRIEGCSMCGHTGELKVIQLLPATDGLK